MADLDCAEYVIGSDDEGYVTASDEQTSESRHDPGDPPVQTPSFLSDEDMERFEQLDKSFLGNLVAQSKEDTRFKGCIYYTIFGQCIKGAKCPNSEGHTPATAKKTAEWITYRIAKTEKERSSNPRKLYSDPRSH